MQFLKTHLYPIYRDSEADHLGDHSLVGGVVRYLLGREHATISEVAEQLEISIPTATKIIAELVEEQIVVGRGKVETQGGRRPNSYAIADRELYTVGVEVGQEVIRIVMHAISRGVLHKETVRNIKIRQNAETIKNIHQIIKTFIEQCEVDSERVIGVGVALSGMVGDGGESYSVFSNLEGGFKDRLEELLGVEVLVESSSRVRCYEERVHAASEGDIIYLNIGETVGMGMSIGGKLHYGANGLTGEIAHIPMFDNQRLCSCGKRGCLQSEIGEEALVEQARERIQGGESSVLGSLDKIGLPEIIHAVESGDMMAIEIVERAGEKMGRALALILNILNPSSVVFAGEIAQLGDCFMLPLRVATNRYTLNMIYRSTEIRLSTLGEYTVAEGVAKMVERIKTGGVL